MKKGNGPILLEDYVRHKRRRDRLLRGTCAGVLLLAAVVLRCVFPQSAAAVRAWVFGEGTVNAAIEAFYTCAERGEPLQEAVEAMCIVLDGDEN